MSLLALLEFLMGPIWFPKDIIASHLIYSWFPIGALMLSFLRHALYGLLLLCACHICCACADACFWRPNIAIARVVMVAFRWHSQKCMPHIPFGFLRFPLDALNNLIGIPRCAQLGFLRTSLLAILFTNGFLLRPMGTPWGLRCTYQRFAWGSLRGCTIEGGTT